MLGGAGHLDGEYTVFAKMEKCPEASNILDTIVAASLADDHL